MPLLGDRSACWLANMSSNSRNLKLSFLTTRGLYWAIDLPVDQPIWAPTVEISSHHSWPLDASTGGVDLPVDLPIWTLIVEISSHHSWPLDASTTGIDLPVDLPIWALTEEISNCHPLLPDASTGGIDLPVDLPIWALTVEISSHHSWPLESSTRGGKSTSWSVNMSSNSRNLKSPFLTTRCLYQGG